jgi:hypothetical protein
MIYFQWFIEQICCYQFIEIYGLEWVFDEDLGGYFTSVNSPQVFLGVD